MSLRTALVALLGFSTFSIAKPIRQFGGLRLTHLSPKLEGQTSYSSPYLYIDQKGLTFGKYMYFAWSGNGQFEKIFPRGLLCGFYLRIDKQGKLDFAYDTHTNFTLSEENSTFSEMLLTYNNETTFELCGDNSFGYKSGCANSTNVSIAFDGESWTDDIIFH